MTDYRTSRAYLRSNRLRADGRPLWPLTDADLPSRKIEQISPKGSMQICRDLRIKADQHAEYRQLEALVEASRRVG